MRLYKDWGIFLLLTLVSYSALAEATDTLPPAREWLEKMAHAGHQLSYTGTFVYLHDGHFVSMRITHAVDEEGKEHEHLVALNGTGREITRENSAITSIAPSKAGPDDKSRLRRTLPETLAKELWQLEGHYTFSLMGEERVADRMTRLVVIQPKDSFRYGYKLWVDVESKLLLKADMLDDTGAPVEQLMFTNIDFEGASAASPHATEVPQTDAQLLEEARKDQASMQLFMQNFSTLSKDLQRDWLISDLPDGFRLIEYNNYPAPVTHTPVEHLVLSDGLSAVSIFIEKFSSEDKFVGSSHRGAVNAFGLVTNGYQVTLVGEVPQATVKVIGQSIKYVGQPVAAQP